MPLGYDVKDRKLVVNPVEAETVRSIFRRYLDLKSVRLLKADLDARGIVSKVRKAADGSPYGGKPIARGALYLMLQNRIYRGEIVHKDKSYPGEHQAIVDAALWDKVQAHPAENRVDRRTEGAVREPSLLTGRIFDAQGRPDEPGTCQQERACATVITCPPSAGRVGDAPRARASGYCGPARSASSSADFISKLGDSTFVLDCVASDLSIDAVSQKRWSSTRDTWPWQDNDCHHQRCPLPDSSMPRARQVHTDRIDLTLQPGSIRRLAPGKAVNNNGAAGSHP